MGQNPPPTLTGVETRLILAVPVQAHRARYVPDREQSLQLQTYSNNSRPPRNKGFRESTRAWFTLAVWASGVRGPSAPPVRPGLSLCERKPSSFLVAVFFDWLLSFAFCLPAHSRYARAPRRVTAQGSSRNRRACVSSSSTSSALETTARQSSIAARR